ncbi:conserved Plasmodium protein, unknown function [Plasmodium chabaudi chabaudi]|uniref:Uncharacterized protein n=1 Tax=Plasmodium chabaudi chabaudi TaxID=31271 RepID=A0A1C6XBC5_PLACU|nr:conserved Plasmodium protein, unknown function [Plasmodium chabaudi chabaudi]
MSFEYDIKKRKKKKKKYTFEENNSIDDELLGISELFKDNDDEINNNNNEKGGNENEEISEDNEEDIQYKENYVRNKNSWKGGEYNNSKDESSKHDPNVEDKENELKDEDEKKKDIDAKYNLFISKSYIKTIGLLYNITNDKTMFENDACFEQISNIIELRVKQIIEEASKFYEKRKRFCVNKYLNINDLTNSCNYLNVKIPYQYKSSIYNPNFTSLDKNSKNNKTLYRLINKQGYKNNSKKLTKKNKNTNIQKLKKKKKGINFNLSVDNIFKDWKDNDHNNTNLYTEFSDLKNEKSDNIDKDDFIKKPNLSDNDNSENERKELSYNFDENEDDKEVSFPDGEGCADVITNLEADIGSDLDVELDVPQKENGSDNDEQNIEQSLMSYEIDINDLKLDDNNISTSSIIEHKEFFENVELDDQLGIDVSKTELQNNIELNKDKKIDFDLFEMKKTSDENKIADSDDEINIEENNLLHDWHVKKNENNKKNVLNVLFNDMQNVLPLEENLTVFWVFIQNQYKKKKRKKDKMKKNDEERDEVVENRHNKLMHFDYQCYEILYTIEKREDNLYQKNVKTDKEEVYNSYTNGYTNYTKFKGDIGNSYTNFDQERFYDSSYSNEGNIFLLPKLRPINKEYTILLKYILEIIKDIINYRTNFFDYNNILHIFSTSKEINKILPNILFFLFNELDHNLRFNNIYSGLMLLILLNGIIKNRNIDIDFYCLQILKMLIHVIIYEHDLKLKNIYLILLFKRKACDIIIDFCSLLRIKNNNEIINIDYYLAYILSKLLTHNKCTYMHIYVSYYLIYLMPINIHIKFFLSYTPNFLSIFFRKYLYYQNVYNILLSYEQKEISELFNFFFFHIYTLIQGSLYKIFKHLGILIFNSSSSIYLNYLLNFIAEYADYHLPLILSITNILGGSIEEDDSTTSDSESEWDSSIDSDWFDRKGMSSHTNGVNNLLFKKMNKIKNKINIKSEIKNKIDKVGKKKKKNVFDISTIKMYGLKKNSYHLSKNKNYLKNINKLYNLYLQSEKNNDDYSLDDFGNDDNLSLNINTNEKQAYLSSYIQKRIILNQELIQRASEEKELQTSIVVNQVLSNILYNFNAKERHKTKSHIRCSNANLYDSYYYFLYTL